MRKSRNDCDCRGTEFDAESAYQELAAKQQKLAELMASYMGEAGLKRPQRVRNAKGMSAAAAVIVGGWPAVPGQFPDCCLIGTRFNNGFIDWKCTGVLVHPQVVLTAAHCNPNGGWANTVAFGAVDVKDLSNAEIVNVFRSRSHPQYTNGINDIAVLILERPVNARHVGIATTNRLNAANGIRLAGFGSNSLSGKSGFGRQRFLDTDIRSIRRSPADPLNGDEMLYGYESDSEFVAGGNDHDSCYGDSGGPAYINTAQGLKVAGLTSRGVAAMFPNSTPCGEGGVYTRIDAHLNFIRSITSQAGINFP